MRGSPVAIGLKFGAICLLCSAGEKHPSVDARTTAAHCSHRVDNCRF